MNKKLMSLILTAVMLLAAVSGITVFGADVKDSGVCGDNLTWTLTADGVLTISGTGAMDDWSWNGAPWYSYREAITSAVVGNGATTIGEYAFYGCISLTSVELPDSVTSIGISAFEKCSSLTSVKLPDSLASIGDGAFEKCTGLTSISLPDGVTSIDDSTFDGCSGLTSVELPDGLTSIGDWAFDGCSSLVSMKLPDGVTSIGDGAFDGCSSLISVRLPDRVTSIGEDAFWDCSSLTSVNLPDGLISIGVSAFEKCTALTSITIPGSVTSIGDGAFYNCSSLTDIYYSGTEEQWQSIDLGQYNATLSGTAVHYNYIPVPKITYAAAEVKNDAVTVTVYTENVPDSDFVIAVGYGVGGKYLGCVEIENGRAQLDKEAKSVKVLVWKSLDSMMPICEAKTVTVK